jgi:hypothetical protein
MKKIIRLTESDLARIVKMVIKESNDDPRMYHRYTEGGNPGIEDFLKNPLNDAIARELEDQLEDDEYANIDNPTNIGRGTRVLKIKLNGREMSIDDFIDQIQEDAEDGICHTIDEYEYKNRFLGSTVITIKTDTGSCKGISQQQNQTNSFSASTSISPNYDFDTEDEFGDLINKYDSKSADKLKTDVINSKIKEKKFPDIKVNVRNVSRGKTQIVSAEYTQEYENFVIFCELDRRKYKINDLLEISFMFDKVIKEVGVNSLGSGEDYFFDLPTNGVRNLKTEVVGDKTLVKFEFEIKKMWNFGFDAFVDEKREVMKNFEGTYNGVDHKKNPYKVLFAEFQFQNL